MADMYVVNKADMTAIADALRTKGGTSDALAFPGGFVNAIGAIQAGTGGGNDNVLKAIVDRSVVDVELPDDIVAIGDYAFYMCAALEMVSIPETTTTIGNYSFGECAKLALAGLPDSIESIGKNAFHKCKALAITNLPKNLTTIGDSAFMESSIAISEIPDGVTSIGERVFQSCNQVGDDIIFPESLLTVGNMVFAWASIKSVTFKGTPDSIHSGAFSSSGVSTINVAWAENEVAGAPWGARDATINYNYTGG